MSKNLFTGSISARGIVASFLKLISKRRSLIISDIIISSIENGELKKILLKHYSSNEVDEILKNLNNTPAKQSNKKEVYAESESFKIDKFDI